MPNKYNFPTLSIKFVPSQVKTATKLTKLSASSKNADPMVQISDENDVQILYYFDTILIYKLDTANFFVIKVLSSKNQELYILFNVVVSQENSTHNGSSVARILNILNTQNQSTEQTVVVDFNADLRGREIKRVGNVFYAGAINTSYTFPYGEAVSPTLLDNELKSIKNPPTGADKVQFLQEEIQWVLDCNQIGEYGKEMPVMETKNKYATMIVTFLMLMLVIIFGYVIWHILTSKVGGMNMSNTPINYAAAISKNMGIFGGYIKLLFGSIARIFTGNPDANPGSAAVAAATGATPKQSISSSISKVTNFFSKKNP